MSCLNLKCKNIEFGENYVFCFVCGFRILKLNGEVSLLLVDDKNKIFIMNEEDFDVQEDIDVLCGKISEYKFILVGVFNVVIEFDSFEKKEYNEILFYNLLKD